MIGPALCVVWLVNDLAEEFEKKLQPTMAALVAKYQLADAAISPRYRPVIDAQVVTPLQC